MDYSRYKVFLHSTPAPGWTFYEVVRTVYAADSEDAKDRAKRELKRSDFPDRPLSSWVVDRVVTQ